LSSRPQQALSMPYAHVYGEATLAGHASAVSIPTHHFLAAGVIEIIWDILQKESQVIELAKSSPDSSSRR
jgi:hypothetical protein